MDRRPKMYSTNSTGKQSVVASGTHDEDMPETCRGWLHARANERNDEGGVRLTRNEVRRTDGGLDACTCVCVRACECMNASVRTNETNERGQARQRQSKSNQKQKKTTFGPC